MAEWEGALVKRGRCGDSRGGRHRPDKRGGGLSWGEARRAQAEGCGYPSHLLGAVGVGGDPSGRGSQRRIRTGLHKVEPGLAVGCAVGGPSPSPPKHPLNCSQAKAPLNNVWRG